jgi:hypothetical protein
MVKHDALKENLYNFYTANKHLSRKEIFDRFIAIGAPERSLNRWLCNLEQNKTLKRKKGSGRIAKKATPKVIKAIKRQFNQRTGCSQRKTASAFNLTVSHVNYILKKYSDIRKYKKFKRPLMNDQQRAQLRPKCRKLLNKYRDYNFIIDDESYFTLSHTTQPGNDIFSSNNIQKTPESVKNKYEIKYEKKVLVWIAISQKGITEPFFVNQD